jgi:hypothetical protein
MPRTSLFQKKSRRSESIDVSCFVCLQTAKDEGAAEMDTSAALYYFLVFAFWLVTGAFRPADCLRLRRVFCRCGLP